MREGGGRERKIEKENGERKKKEINMDEILTQTNGQNLQEKRKMQRNGRKRDGERKKWRMRYGERERESGEWEMEREKSEEITNIEEMERKDKWREINGKINKERKWEREKKERERDKRTKDREREKKRKERERKNIKGEGKNIQRERERSIFKMKYRINLKHFLKKIDGKKCLRIL